MYYVIVLTSLSVQSALQRGNVALRKFSLISYIPSLSINLAQYVSSVRKPNSKPNLISGELVYWPPLGGMPKKSKWGENPKAVEARQKKEDKKVEEEVRKQKALEDEYWRDDDKYVKRKEERKVRIYVRT